MVCEKSDGERAMLLLLNAPRGGVPAGGYLLNRSFEPMTFNRALDYAQLLAAQGPTLLEGELLQRLDDAGTNTAALAVFMMFDAVWVQGRDVGSQPLPARLHALGNDIRVPFRKVDDGALAEMKPRLPLYLAGKTMLDKSKSRDVLSKVSVAAQHHEAHGAQRAGGATAPLESEMGLSATGGSGASRVYREGIRVNGTDGLIFTPCTPTYRDLLLAGASLPTPLLKWKYQDENTIDFSVSADDLEKVAYATEGTSSSATPSPVALCINTGGHADIPLTHTLLSAAQAQAYLTLADKLGKALIVEAGFDGQTSSWTIRRVRDRKTRSNFIRTAWSTLEAVAEGITGVEISDKLGRAGAAAGGVAGGSAR